MDWFLHEWMCQWLSSTSSERCKWNSLSIKGEECVKEREGVCVSGEEWLEKVGEVRKRGGNIDGGADKSGSWRWG